MKQNLCCIFVGFDGTDILSHYLFDKAKLINEIHIESTVLWCEP